jgi:hypothetical protein
VRIAKRAKPGVFKPFLNTFSRRCPSQVASRIISKGAFAMRTRVSIFAAFAVMATSAVIFATSGVQSEAKSAKTRDFIIAGSEGYGTQECLASQSHCGRIVADAWCEAKGFKAALAYRQLERDEITGSAAPLTNGLKPVENFLISCKD